jgi:Membrane domain of glycerophosphoryl diester phosphodiesterase
VLTAVVSVLLLPVVAFAMATTVEIVDALAQGREISGPTAFQRVLVHPGGWVVAIIAYLVVSLLAATWWLLPVALYLLARWAVALPATELEDEGVRAGLRRSSQITKGHRMRAALLGGFLVWLAFSLPASIGAIVLLITGWPFWATNLIALVIAAVLVPAATIGLTLLYYDLRIRHDVPEPEPSPAG